MGGKIPATKKRVQPGRAGLSRHAESPALAYWLENLVVTDEGYFRPRYGLKHCKTMGSGEIRHISKPGGYNARLMLIGESGTLYDLHTETGVATSVGTGWPTGPVAATVGNVPGGATRWLACRGTIGGTSGPVFHYDLSTLTELVTTAPGDGNWIANVMGSIFRLVSGVGTEDAMQWSKVNDALTWDTLYQHPPPQGLTGADAILPWGPREGILLGPNGIVRVAGIPPRNLSFERISNVDVATPMFHPFFAKDRIFFCGPGPRVYMLVQPGVVQDITPPIFRDLMLALGPSNLVGWYDGVMDEAVLWDRTQKLGYRYSLRTNAWVGVLTYTGAATNMLGAVIIDQGASTSDQATMPWGRQFFAVNNMILQTDPSVYTDATSSSTTAAYTCKVEAQVERPDPNYRYQLLSLHIHGSGSWTPYFKYRTSPDGSWTTVTGSALTAPDRWYPPLSSVEWTELVVGASASSASGVRFHSFEPEWQVSGRP